MFPMRERENGLSREGFSSTKAVFPFSRGKNRISQGVENRGSLISVPLALRVEPFVLLAFFPQFSSSSRVLSDPNRSDFESQIASDCNRNSKKSLRLRKHL